MGGRWVRGVRLAALAMLAAGWGGVGALGDNEYPLGVEGIRAATLPPPGSYYRQYNVFYNSRRLNGPGGVRAVPSFDVSVYAMTHRFVWVSKLKVLGADYAVDFILPTINTDLRMNIPAPGPGAIHDSRWGIGDVCLEPLILGWHGKRWDATAALGFFAPTGKFKASQPASPGKAMWTLMPSLGGTWYIDPQRTWSVSVLGRGEIHSRQQHTSRKPGMDLHTDWGIAKTIARKNAIWDLGLTGYTQWQLTKDTGPGATSTALDSAYAVGPEVAVFLPQNLLMLSVRWQEELSAVDRSLGNQLTFTATGIF